MNDKKAKVLLLFENAEKYVNLFKVSGITFYTSSDSFNTHEIEGIIVFHSDDLKRIDPQKFSSLKIIKTLTAGTDHIKEYWKNRYKVIGTHGPNAKYIAEHALALSLACARKLVFHTESMKKGEFHQTDIYHLTMFNSNVLVLGFGPIGRYTAGLFKRAFKSHITVYKKTPKIPHLYEKIVDQTITDFGKLLSLLFNFDTIINTLPLTPQTENLLASDFFSCLKNNTIVVNVSRGKIISEEHLFKFLKENKNACAGIDVWYKYPKGNEPFKQNFPFENLDNIVMTPHNAPLVKGYFYNMVKGAMFQIKWDLKKIKEGQ